MSLFVEVWRRPGHANFGRIVNEPPTSRFSFRDGVVIVGEGDMLLPDSWDMFQLLLFLDQVTPANSVSSLVRVLDDAVNPPKLVFEWLPRTMLPPEFKQSHEVSVEGAGIKALIEYAVTEAWDWDGSSYWEPAFPDWIYGGTNIMGNPGMETPTCRPEINELRFNSWGGSFTLSDGVDTTAPIAWDASPTAVELALEALPGIDDVLVTGTGQPYEFRLSEILTSFTITDGTNTTGSISSTPTETNIRTALESLPSISNATVTKEGSQFTIRIADPEEGIALDIASGTASLVPVEWRNPYRIETVNPCTQAGGFILDTSGITGGSGSLVRTQFGALMPQPWTESQTVSRGVHKVFGKYDSFRVTSTEAHSGSYSLLIDPAEIERDADRFTGAQQVLTVTPGGLYQAAVWIYPTSGSDRFRFIIRGIDEDHIAGDVSGTTFTPNQWNLWTIPDVNVGDNSQVIFRVANVNNPDLGHPSDPSIFYLDDAEFKEGMPPTTIGQILRELYEDATIDHAGRVVWDDAANPGTPYLTLDFTDSEDSAGQPWLHPEISIQIWMRQSYLQVMETFVDTYGYEWRVVPDDYEAGTWKWQVFNPGTMGTDYSSDPWPGVQGGAEDTNRRIEQFHPTATHSLMEGLERRTARATSAALVAAFGRIETATLDREAPDNLSVVSAADLSIQRALESGVQYGFELTEPETVPLVDYELGDTLKLTDPPYVEAPARFAEVQVVVEPEATVYETTFLPPEPIPESPGDE